MSKVPWLPLWVGFVGHLVFWMLVVNFDSTPWDFACGEISCWVLFFAELPVSLMYLSGTSATVTIGSLVLGSLWWGMVLYGVVRIGKKLVRPGQAGQAE